MSDQTSSIREDRGPVGGPHLESPRSAQRTVAGTDGAIARCRRRGERRLRGPGGRADGRRDGLLRGHGPERSRRNGRGARGGGARPSPRSQEFADLVQRLHTLPKPTVAAVNGDALAAGAGLMAACDLAVAADDRPDRLSRGAARAGRRDRHARPDPADRRPPRPAIALGGGELISAKVAHRLGAGQSGHHSRRLPGRGDPSRRRACADGAPMALATTKRLLDETAARPRRPAGSGRHQRGHSLLRGGARRNPRVRREAFAGVGLVVDTEERRMNDPGHEAHYPWVGTRRSASVLESYGPAVSAITMPWSFRALKLRWSWSELDRRVSQVAAALIALGVEPGEHVGIWSMNVPEWVVTQFAAGGSAPCW